MTKILYIYLKKGYYFYFLNISVTNFKLAAILNNTHFILLFI